MKVALVFAAAIVLLPGCFWVTTKDEGNALRHDITALKDQQAKETDGLVARTKQLDEALAKVTKLLTTNNADLGTEVDKMAEVQAAQAGQIENLQRMAVAFRAEIDGLKADNAELRAKLNQPPPGPPPVDKDGLFARAQASLKGGQYADAQRDFREYLRLYSADLRADDAQYALGEIWFRQKAFEKAIAEFQRVIDAWPTGDMAPFAYYRAGEAALEMKWCVDARAYFGVLVQKFPKSEQAKDAKTKLDFIKKNTAKKAICST